MSAFCRGLPVLLAQLLVACGGSSPSRVAITGGQAASDGAPQVVRTSVVALAANSDFFNTRVNPASAFCTGAIISPHLVLTAGHCSEMLDRQETLVVFANTMAEGLRNSRVRTRQVRGFVRHPGYPMEVNSAGVLTSPYSLSPELWMREHPGQPPHDLAILRFQGDLPSGYAPVDVANAEEPLPPAALLAGFGITSTFNISDNGVLRFVNSVVVHQPDEDTSSRFWLPVAETVDVSRIMAGEKPRGACPGDSGGPAFREEGAAAQLMGILSLGESERAGPGERLIYCLGSKKGAPTSVGNIYTDVRRYRDWIDTVRKRLDP